MDAKKYIELVAEQGNFTPFNIMKMIRDIMQIEDERTLLKSKMNCHSPHLSSIVFSSEGQRLYRIFLAWHGHLMESNDPSGLKDKQYNPIIGLHEHRYDITILPLFGEIKNVVEDNDDVQVMPDYFSFNKFNTTKMGDIKRVDQRALKVNKLNAMEPVFMHHHEVHTVAAKGLAAWVVFEGQSYEKVPEMLSKEDTINVDGLYTPFRSVGDIMNHFDSFLRMVR